MVCFRFFALLAQKNELFFGLHQSIVQKAQVQKATMVKFTKAAALAWCDMARPGPSAPNAPFGDKFVVKKRMVKPIKPAESCKSSSNKRSNLATMRHIMKTARENKKSATCPRFRK